jgi:hypothetical protein
MKTRIILLIVAMFLTVAFASPAAAHKLISFKGGMHSIYTKIVGSLEKTSTPGISIITEIDTITGGTGRFADAQGFFTVNARRKQ